MAAHSHYALKRAWLVRGAMECHLRQYHRRKARACPHTCSFKTTQQGDAMVSRMIRFRGEVEAALFERDFQPTLIPLAYRRCSWLAAQSLGQILPSLAIPEVCQRR
jgi:hypothetical protein